MSARLIEAGRPMHHLVTARLSTELRPDGGLKSAVELLHSSAAAAAMPIQQQQQPVSVVRYHCVAAYSIFSR